MTKRLFLASCVCSLLLILGACSKAPNRYYPLAKGRTWKYQITIKGGFGQQADATISVTNLPARPVHGKIVTPQKTAMQYHGQTQYEFDYMASDASGIYTFAVQHPGDVEPKVTSPVEYTLKRPIKVGSSWSASVDSPNGHTEPGKATIEKLDDTVDVPAGTFRNCVEVHIVGTAKRTPPEEQYLWFAPSVGLVKQVTKVSNNSASLQLVSFTK